MCVIRLIDHFVAKVEQSATNFFFLLFFVCSRRTNERCSKRQMALWRSDDPTEKSWFTNCNWVAQEYKGRHTHTHTHTLTSAHTDMSRHTLLHVWPCDPMSRPPRVTHTHADRHTHTHTHTHTLILLNLFTSDLQQSSNSNQLEWKRILLLLCFCSSVFIDSRWRCLTRLVTFQRLFFFLRDTNIGCERWSFSAAAEVVVFGSLESLFLFFYLYGHFAASHRPQTGNMFCSLCFSLSLFERTRKTFLQS